MFPHKTCSCHKIQKKFRLDTAPLSNGGTSDQYWWVWYKWAREATNTISSMHCSQFLSAWPTSAPEIAALRSLLPMLFCYLISPATTLETGARKEERMAQGEPFLYSLQGLWKALRHLWRWSFIVNTGCICLLNGHVRLSMGFNV